MIGINVRNQQPANEEPKNAAQGTAPKIIINFYYYYLYLAPQYGGCKKEFFSPKKRAYKLYILTAYFYMNYKLMNPCLELVIKVIAVCGINKQIESLIFK